MGLGHRPSRSTSASPLAPTPKQRCVPLGQLGQQPMRRSALGTSGLAGAPVRRVAAQPCTARSPSAGPFPQAAAATRLTPADSAAHGPPPRGALALVCHSCSYLSTPRYRRSVGAGL